MNIHKLKWSQKKNVLGKALNLYQHLYTLWIGITGIWLSSSLVLYLQYRSIWLSSTSSFVLAVPQYMTKF